IKEVNMNKTQNVTLSIPKEILRKAKILAVRKNTSLSGLLSQTLAAMVSEDEKFDQARQRMIKLMRKGLNLGTQGSISWTREDLHDRKST
ncbi:MAG TPA: DUF6364 family protein, partial [Bellilinea sp.]|nr:DUF6364 family protein [Bellilinea sp.]